MKEPTILDPVAWARWNDLQREAVSLIAERLRMPPSFSDLEAAINRAASELENQGEKSNRIAMQLLTALARFHSETGT